MKSSGTFVFRHAWVVLFAMSLLAASGSLIYLILGGSFEPNALQAVAEAGKASPNAERFLNGLLRLVGLNWLMWNLISASIAATAFKRGELWAWGTLWIVPAYWIGDGLLDRHAGGIAWPGAIIWSALTAAVLLVAPQRAMLFRARATAQ